MKFASLRYLKPLAAIILMLGIFSIGFTNPVPAVADDDSEQSMRWFGSGDEVDDSSAELERNENSVELTIETTGLNPGHIYTFWWVLFEDGAPPNPNSAVFWGGYFIPDEDGEVEIEKTLNEGTLPPPPAQIRKPGTATGPIPGLRNAQTAEIHIPLVDHGPPQPGNEEAQKYTFEGGCGNPVNSGACPIQQFVVFVAGDDDDDEDEDD